MGGAAADDAAERDERIEAAGAGQPAERCRYLPCSGHPYGLDRVVGDAVAHQTVAGPGEQWTGDQVVEASHHDPESPAVAAEVSLVLDHPCAATGVWTSSAASASGRRWPIFSRLVAR